MCMIMRFDLCTMLAVLLPVSACRREPSDTYRMRDSARATIGNSRFEIDYVRPLARGHTLVVCCVPWQRPPRCGQVVRAEKQNKQKKLQHVGK